MRFQHTQIIQENHPKKGGGRERKKTETMQREGEGKIE